MTDRRWKALTVPYEIVAADNSDPQCYRLSGKTVRMLLAMIQYMEWRTRWHKVDGSELNLTEIDNVQAWAAQGAYELMTPEPCADESCEDGDCVAYYPTNPRFSYAPNDPFVQCETSPAGYLTCPLVSGLSVGIPGALPDDIYCTIPTLLPAPPLGLIDQALNSGFPRVHMEFSGSGEVEVHLLEVAQGGLAIIRIDDVAYVNVVDLQGIALADIAVSLDFVISVVTGLLDWKFVNEKIIEFSVPSGDHTLDILFIPNLSLNILETGWGGGLRSVVLCGDFTSVDCPETIIDPIGGGGGTVAGMFDLCWFIDGDGVKILRYTINGGCTWNDVGICGDSVGTVTPPIVIDPIDKPGEIPDPDDDEETICKIANTVFRRVYEENAYAFITSVLTGSVSGLGSRLITFLNGFAGGNNGVIYYTAWKPLVEKWYPHVADLTAAYDSAIYPEYIQCVVVACVPANGIIDKAVKDCIADGIEALTGVPYFTVGSGGYPPMQEYLVDFTNLMPLTYLRDQAFFVNGQPLESPCVECDGLPLPGGDCENRVITFDAPTEYTATIGVEGIGRTALGLKSINVPLGTFAAAPAEWSAKVWGSRIIVPLEEAGCTVKEIFFRQKSTTTPELNANTAVNVWMTVKGWLGETLVHSSSGFNTVLYYNLATSWGRYGREINTPFVADSLEIEWFIGTPNSARTWYQTVDDLEIVFG